MTLTPEQARDLASFRKAALLAARGRIGKTDLNVYRALVDCIHWPDMTAFKSTARIAEEVNATERTVERCKKRLKEMGAIKALAFENGGRGRSTVYAFPMVNDKPRQNSGGLSAETPTKKTYKPRQKERPYNSLSDIKKGAASRRREDKAHGDAVVRHLEAVEPSEVRAMLQGWGYSGADIDGFSEREVSALLGAEGYKLKR